MRFALDLNADVTLRKNLSLDATASNVFNVYETWPRYGPHTPSPTKSVATACKSLPAVKGTF